MFSTEKYNFASLSMSLENKLQNIKTLNPDFLSKYLLNYKIFIYLGYFSFIDFKSFIRFRYFDFVNFDDFEEEIYLRKNS